MACMFPGADSLEEVWDLLTKGTCVVQELPQERFWLQALRRSPDGKLKFWGACCETLAGGVTVGFCHMSAGRLMPDPWKD